MNNILLAIINHFGGGGSGTSFPPPPVDDVPLGTPVGALANILPVGDSNTANGIWVGRVSSTMDTSKFSPILMVAAYAGFTGDGISGRNGTNQGVRGGLVVWGASRVFDHTKRNLAMVKATTNDINNGSDAASAEVSYTYLSEQLFEYGFLIIGTAIFDPGRDNTGANTKPAYLTYLPWIQANWNTTLKWDAIHDESLDPRTEGYLPGNDAYWGSGGADHVHHSTLGNEPIADDFLAQAEYLIANKPCYYPAAPTSMVINNTAHTVGFTESEGYPDASDYQFTTNGGVTVQRATSLPIPIPHTVNAGLFGVRVGPKVVNGTHNNPSAWLFNSTDAVGSSGYASEEYVHWFDSRITGAGSFNQTANYYIYASGPGAALTFTIREGFKFEFDFGIYGGGIWLAEVSTDNGATWSTVATGTQGANTPIIDYHSGNGTPKLARLTTQSNGTGSYNIFSGITLYQ